MKKILALMLIILSVCSVCSARGLFSRRETSVDPGRWVKLYTAGEYVYYIDNTSIKFTKEAYGTAADVWIMAENTKDKTRDRANIELNMEKHEIRALGTYAYNKKDKLISENRTPEEFRPINENSYEGALYKTMQAYHEKLNQHNYQIPTR